MYNISNALVFDDKVNLLVQKEDVDANDLSEYKNLKTIQTFFLNNSIPFSIIDKISDSAIDAIEKIKNSTKPDLVVLDLDLNSNGEIDDLDVRMLMVILQTLKSHFGDFIVMIYSSEVESWNRVKKEIIELDTSLSDVLAKENVIVFSKTEVADTNFNEGLSVEIIQKEEGYFNRQIISVNNRVKSLWNKEVVVICFFFIMLLSVIKLSAIATNCILYLSAMFIMIAVTLFFIFLKYNTLKK